MNVGYRTKVPFHFMEVEMVDLLREVIINDLVLQFAPSEFIIISLLVKRRSVVSTHTLLEALGGVSRKTLRNRISDVNRQFQAFSSGISILSVRGHGYMLNFEHMEANEGIFANS